MMLREGDIAPDFSLPNQDGVRVHLSDFLGKKVVVYFYPKDESAGCTREACSFRNDSQEFKNRNTIILGISFDNQQSHQQFIEKFNLPFQLLSDIDTRVATKYGVYGEKEMYGKKFMRLQRATFIIDEQGKICHVFENVNPTNHAKKVLEKL